MGVHEDDELRFIYPEESHKGGDFLILDLVLIVGEIFTEGTLGIDLEAASLDFVEENFGDSFQSVLKMSLLQHGRSSNAKV